MGKWMEAITMGDWSSAIKVASALARIAPAMVAAVKCIAGQIATRRRSGKDRRYLSWVNAVVGALTAPGRLGNGVKVSEDTREWAFRAVQEGRLRWTFPMAVVGLPE